MECQTVRLSKMFLLSALTLRIRAARNEEAVLRQERNSAASGRTMSVFVGVQHAHLSLRKLDVRSSTYTPYLEWEGS